MKKPWLKSYSINVPEEIQENSLNIVDILENSMEKFQERIAYSCMGETLTYGQLDELSQKFSIYLQTKLGLRKGDRIALMMPNLLQYPLALFGILRSGMIVVNINPLYTARELKYQLNDAGVVAIVILENSTHILQEILNETPVKYILTTQVGDLFKFPHSKVVNFMVKYIKKMIPSWSIPHARDFIKELKSIDIKKFVKTKISCQDTAFLQYTGGTTGVSKAAELTHRNIVSNIKQIEVWLQERLQEDEQEIVITALPLYHIFSLTTNGFYCFSLGALNVLITNPKDFRGFVKELKKWPFSVITGVSTLFNALLDTDGFKEIDFSHLKLSLSGGMSTPKIVSDRWQKFTETPLIEAYGLSETSPAVCINPMSQRVFSGTVGLPIPSTIVQIVNSKDEILPVGEEGELCIKGPQVMKGYWKSPKETAKVMMKNKFLRTGDIAIMDEKGFIKIIDRKKDMILVSGFNVYPNEIEEVISAHPKVFECAAVGVSDLKSGEVVKLFVVKKEEDLTEKDLQLFCIKYLTAYKCPKYYEFLKTLPKSNVGKILRKDLKIYK